MQNFVIVGKAKTVFRLIELKAKQEAGGQERQKAGFQEKITVICLS